MVRWIVATLALAVLAGCLGDNQPDERADDGTMEPPAPIVPAEDVTPVEGDPIPWLPPHVHKDPSHHEVELNMALLSRPTMPTPPEERPVEVGLGAYGELDHAGNLLAQCAPDGVLLWDIYERATPRLLSILETGPACSDVKLTDDGAFAVVGGSQLWDLRDPADPVQVVDDGRGCHMCAIHVIGDKEYVVGNGMWIVELVRDPPGFEPVSEWGPGESCDSTNPDYWMNPRLPDPDFALIGQFHDMYVYTDPLVNRTFAVPAHWDCGVFFVDITDPANPESAGHWNEYFGESGDIHTTSVEIMDIDGTPRRIVAAATETGGIIGPFSSATPASIYILDATDLSDIKLVARWINPGKHPTGTDPAFFPVGEYSTHNLQLEQGRIYVSHYHAGVWVLDARAAVEAYVAAGAQDSQDGHLVGDEVPVLGVYMTRDPERQISGAIWDVVVSHGAVYVSDYNLGLFALRFLGDPLGDPLFTSDA